MDEKSIAKLFGDQLKKVRQEKGLSQEKLALMSGFHPTYISHLETGKKHPTLLTLVKISKCLEVQLNDLLRPFQ